MQMISAANLEKHDKTGEKLMKSLKKQVKLRKAHEKYKIIEEPEIQIKKLMKSMNKQMKSLGKDPKSR